MLNDLGFQAYLDRLAIEILDTADREGTTTSRAAERVIGARLGYDSEDLEFVDGSGDRGIDFWHSSEGGLYVYQVKTHEFLDNRRINYEKKFDAEGVKDLMRVQNFLLSTEPIDVDHRLAKVKDTFLRLIENHRFQEIEHPLHVYLSLVILGEELTQEAFTELANLEANCQQPCNFTGIDVQFHITFQTIRDILAAEWRQNNDEWKDRNGKKRNSIRLTPLRQADKRDYLNDSKSAIFYCSAADLVQAYEDFGYQIFAPNVRANIKNSNVNNAILESASYAKSMREFRFLNNGLTIICQSYKLPAGGRAAFEVIEPGIVNGLQTVVSLHKARRMLTSDRARQEFDDNCYVLVRLLRTDAVEQITDVVLATNNQNPMQPRNLKSNSSEQTHFFLFYANTLNWFYEAKQGAWDAFKKDERGWRPRVNKSAQAFKGRNGAFKKIDNLDLAQDWLAFLGFAERAANDRKYLFDKDKRYYDLIFLRRPIYHAYLHQMSLDEMLSNAEQDTPDPHTMLAAHLAHKFVDEVVPSVHINRKQALERHGITDRHNISAIEEARILSEDREYSLNQALGTMSLIFVEFVGYTLYRIAGAEAHRCGHLILQNRSWRAIYEELDLKSAVDKATNIDKNLADDDLLIIMWLFFREAVQTVLNGAWQTAYMNARYKPRFVLTNRNQLYQELNTMDEFVQRRVPLRIWANGIREGEGFYGYIQRILLR